MKSKKKDSKEVTDVEVKKPIKLKGQEAIDSLNEMWKEEDKVDTPTTKKKKVKTLSYIDYCNSLGASKAIHFVAELNFRKEGRHTKDEWKEMFEKINLV